MDKKKRILIFTPGAVGGAERMAVTIGRMLPRESYDVEFVICGTLKSIENILPEGYKVDRIAFHNKYCFATLRIWWKIVTSRADIVFSSLAFINYRVILAAKFSNAKIIIRSSNMIGNYKRSSQRYCRMIYPLADILIAQQEDMRQEMSRLLHVGLDRIYALNNPLDTVMLDKAENSISPFTDANAINYVNVARINQVKAQDVAIKAMAIVRRKMSNAHLYFVGGYEENDSYYKELCDMVKSKDLQDCIHFIGYDKNPYRWIKNCHCFVFPSRIEGLPNALVEASYLGVPCVAAKCLNIVSDIVKDGYNGYTTAVEDVEALADGMVKAIKLVGFEMTYHPSNKKDFIDVFDKATNREKKVV